MSRLTDPRFLTAKAAAATALGVILAQRLAVPDALSASFVALVCTSPSAYAGLRRGVEQLGGAAVGGAITLGAFALFPAAASSPAVALPLAASIALTTAVCLRLGWTGGHITAGFTVLYLALLPFRSFREAVGVRLAAVVLGVCAATAVNLAVSAVAARRTLARRARLAREAVAEPLARTAAACADPALRLDLAPCYSAAFEVLAELRQDLAGFAREVLIPTRATVRRDAEAERAAAAALEEVAHLGKHIAILLEDDAHPEPRLAEALDAVAGALRAERVPPEVLAALLAAAAEVLAPALRAAAQRLAKALRDADQ